MAAHESVGETRTRLLLRSFGLTMFIPQLEIPTTTGRFRADFAEPESRVVIEFDGSGKYTDYKPTDDVLLAERRRENALIEEGWLVLRLEWKHLARPEERASAYRVHDGPVPDSPCWLTAEAAPTRMSGAG